MRDHYSYHDNTMLVNSQRKTFQNLENYLKCFKDATWLHRLSLLKSPSLISA